MSRMSSFQVDGGKQSSKVEWRDENNLNFFLSPFTPISGLTRIFDLEKLHDERDTTRILSSSKK